MKEVMSLKLPENYELKVTFSINFGKSIKILKGKVYLVMEI